MGRGRDVLLAGGGVGSTVSSTVSSWGTWNKIWEEFLLFRINQIIGNESIYHV